MLHRYHTALVSSVLASALLAACGEPVGEIEFAEPEVRTLEAGPAASSVLPEPLLPAIAPEGQRIPDVLRCLMDRGVTLISAHRGGVEPGFPEHAVETFANTLAGGPMLLEMDVRRTADGVLVMMHDESLERTTTGTGNISDLTFAELSGLQLVDNEGEVTPYRIPSLSEVLNWARGRAFVQLDLKRTVDVEELVGAIRANDAVSYSMVITYTLEDALRAAESDEDVVISIQIRDQERLDALMEAGVDPARLIGWSGVHREPEPEVWNRLIEAGIPPIAGTLWHIDGEVEASGDASVFQTFAEGGVAAIATDLHWTAYRALEERQDTVGAFRACTAD
ncbi:MAG: glycerophosphodiester phosphodiesterase family protein [Oceanicaulis sp.]|uniref:glycerophosphodiester phosphodiesterase family protein n=1 Tax=Glycocaulis sp. TaxID=1969725 RepID=UPI0025B8B4D1|nr:glycerophosphodiester phosphodiesterase family protein [Glycocaulis sp.]MCC5982504.1 glycerophosphodiester phosphodiesterase family protein [Oceanicaulis sp.]MCH8520702.1 glycerophosphodiester phosphodiesterase family protein [Glycocaulis sp.]